MHVRHVRRHFRFASACSLPLVFILLLSACGSAGMSKAAAYDLPRKNEPSGPPPAPMAATGTATTTEAYAFSDEKVTVAGSSGDSMKVAESSDGDNGSSGGGGSGGPPADMTKSVPTNTTTAANTSGAAIEMFDIEARLTLEVERIQDARERVRAMVKEVGGNITGDELNADGNNAEANFVLRIPSARVDAFLEGVNGVGRIKARQVTARDVGKEFHDSTLLLESLQKTMHRYEEILEKAKDVKEILQIEQELARIRTQIDQVKGNLTWLKDRTSRSTVYLRIVPTRPDDILDEPTAKLFPGLRATYMVDARGEGVRDKYVGFGLSIQFARSFTIDLDGMRKTGDGGPFDGLQAFLATAGGDFYSDYLGGGRRRWLNPYLGMRLGYGRIASKNNFITAAVVGLEIYKTKTFLVDAQFRLHGFFGDPDGSHVGLQPSLGFNLAF